MDESPDIIETNSSLAAALRVLVVDNDKAHARSMEESLTRVGSSRNGVAGSRAPRHHCNKPSRGPLSIANRSGSRSRGAIEPRSVYHCPSQSPRIGILEGAAGCAGGS